MSSIRPESSQEIGNENHHQQNEIIHSSAVPNGDANVNAISSQETHNGTQLQEIVTSPRLNLPCDNLLSQKARGEYLSIGIPLYQAALKGDWEAAKGIVELDPWVVRASITRGGETALHIAAAARHVHFVEELVKRTTPVDLELQNKNSNTALCFGAAAGTVKIAEVMVQANPNLLNVPGSQGMTPLYMAALLGHNDMVQYLYDKTKDQSWPREDRIGLFNTCISTGLYDIALDLLDQHPDLAIDRDEKGETALHILAKKTSEFNCGRRKALWRKFLKFLLSINTIWCFSGEKVLRRKSSKPDLIVELTKKLWQMVLEQLEDAQISNLIRNPWRVLFVAAEHGNTNFLLELIRAYPDLIWKVDEKNRSIFHIAVSHRHAGIFNILFEIGSIKDLITSYRDENRNNILHLAAKLAPHNELQIVSGAAFQMQRELLWFQEVEKIVQPLQKEKKNSEGKVPRVLFTEEHKNLVKEGEKWMKTTSSQAMVVATLIATVVFSAAFTVPGGNDNSTGTPIFLKHKSFTVFVISDAIALFSSCTSILMFFAILTSRYTEDDFKRSLPAKLIIGLVTLFVSITAMMIAFTATFFTYNNDLKVVPLALLACVPVILFALLQYPLSADMVHSTYGSQYLFRPRKPLLYGSK